MIQKGLRLRVQTHELVTGSIRNSQLNLSILLLLILFFSFVDERLRIRTGIRMRTGLQYENLSFSFVSNTVFAKQFSQLHLAFSLK